MAKQTLGEYIAAQRQAHNLTQRALADELGITTSYMSMIECNTSIPSRKLWKKICNEIKTDPIRLV